MTYDDNHRLTIVPGTYPGLGEAFAAAGLAFDCNNGTFYCSDQAAGQALIDGYTVAQAKAHVCAEVIAKAGEYFDRATATVTAAEMAGWPILRAEALAYAADNTASCPAMAAEAQQRGCTIAALAVKVTANTRYFDALRAQIAGTSGKHRDAINALASFEQVAQYDFSTSWPTT